MGYKVDTQKLVTFLYMKNKSKEKAVKEFISFKTVSRNSKYHTLAIMQTQINLKEINKLQRLLRTLPKAGLSRALWRGEDRA